MAFSSAEPGHIEYPDLFYSRRRRRRAVLVGLLGLVLIGATIYFSGAYPVNAVLVPLIFLFVALIFRWPFFGLALGLFLTIACEQYEVPDVISTYTILPTKNVNQFTSIPLSATPIEIILVATLVMAVIKAIREGRPVLDKAITSKVVLVLAGFIAFGYIWGVFIKKGDSKASLWEVRALIYVLVIYFLALLLVRTPRHFRILNWTMALGVLVLSFIGIYRAFTISDLVKDLPGFDQSLNGFNHEDAIIMVMLVMWCLVMPLYSKLGTEKFASWLLIAWPVLGILVSGRRSAFASLIFCLVAYLALLWIHHRKVCIALVLTLAIAWPPYSIAFKDNEGPLGMPARALQSNSAQPGSRDYNSDLYRLIEKTNVIQTIKESPLTGIGFGQEFHRYAELISLDVFTFQYFTPHVQVLWLWLKLGMLGWMVFWFLICLSMFKIGQLARYEKSGLSRATAITWGCVIISIMSYAYVDLGLVSTRMMLLLGLSIGLIEIAYRQMPRPVLAKAPEAALPSASGQELVATR